MAPGTLSSRGCAQRRPARPRRCRLRPARVLRLRHRHPGHRPAGRRWHQAGQLPHHGPVLPHPGLSPDGPQPSPQRYGPRGRPGLGLPGILGEAATRERLPVRDPALARLCHLRRREMVSSPEDETHMAASRATWPLGRGFDRWYGFHGGETHQFVPALFHDNHCVRPPRSIDDGYHLSADLADRAVEFLGDLAPWTPTSRSSSTSARRVPDSPHQAPRPWIDRYREAFDDGWDAWRSGPTPGSSPSG